MQFRRFFVAEFYVELQRGNADGLLPSQPLSGQPHIWFYCQCMATMLADAAVCLDPTGREAAPWPQRLPGRRQTRRCRNCRVLPGNGHCHGHGHGTLLMLMLMMRQHRYRHNRHSQHSRHNTPGPGFNGIRNSSRDGKSSRQFQLLLTQQIQILFFVPFCFLFTLHTG